MGKINNETSKYMIVKDRVTYYRDFTMNLVHYIYDFYLDKETLALDQDIYNHFTFCYNKVCDEFLKEEVNFKNNKKLIDYFYSYFYHHFYKSEKEVKKDFFIKFWSTIFDVDKPKNRNTLNVLIELYEVFDQSITKEKNILELI
jgi:hypothetical protein